MKNTLLVFILLFSTLSIHAQDLKDPEANFYYFWNVYKDNYKMFRVKNIEWDSLYKVYRPQVNKNTTNDELFSILSKLMYHLHDSHCWLDNGTFFYKSGTNVTYPLKEWDVYWNKYHTGNFSLPLIESSYIKSKKFKTLLHGDYQYGWLTDSIGYFHFNKFSEPLKINAIMDSILSEFVSAKSIIIDIRNNGGGHDEVNKQILNRFTDQRRLFNVEDSNAYYLFKGDEKFNKKAFSHAEPRGKIRYTNPIVILTDRTSYSSADICASGFKEMSHTTLIGDSTNGCTANMYMLHLPNGWGFTIAMGISYTASGKCIDGGIGVAPDIFIRNSPNDILQGKDKMLERAIAEANTKTFKRVKDKDYSILNAKPPQIGETFANLLLENKTAAAFDYIRRMHEKDPLLCERTIVEEKLHSIAWDFMDAGEHKTAIQIFELNNRLFPYSPNTVFNLGEAYQEISKKSEARKYFQQVKKMNPEFKSNFYVPIDTYLEQK